MTDEPAAASHRFGHVALVGRPNVGKSTLLNALLGTKLSIVTPKPQTTRHRILGVVTRPDAQVAFIDTPGLHQGGKRALNRQLNRIARQVPDEADVLVHVIDGARWRDEDEDVWKMLAGHTAPSLLISKVDVNTIISVNSPALSNMQLILTSGITTNFSEDIEFKPSIFIRYLNGKAFDIHVNGSVWYKDLVSLGFSYRYNDAIMGITELKISDNLSFGYSYGRSIGDRGVFSQGSHEAMLRINLHSNNDQ